MSTFITYWQNETNCNAKSTLKYIWFYFFSLSFFLLRSFSSRLLSILFKRAFLLSSWTASTKVNSNKSNSIIRTTEDERTNDENGGLRNTFWIWFGVQSCDASLSPKWMVQKCELTLMQSIAFITNTQDIVSNDSQIMNMYCKYGVIFI